MIDLALDPSDTRPSRTVSAQGGRPSRLRLIAFAFVAVSALGGFGVAASTLMAGLAAPTPVKRAAQTRAADWPDLKDGLPVLAGTSTATPPAASTPKEPEAPALRMASLPDPIASVQKGLPEKPAPQRAATAPPRPVAAAAPSTEASPAQAVAAPEPAAKRIPTATPVAALGPTRQVSPLGPARLAALQQPLPSDTIRARTEAEPATKAEPAARAASTPANFTSPPAKDKPQRKAVVAQKSAPPAAATASTPVASADTSEPDETEVLGIKLPSLAPAGKKLKDGVEALGEAVRNVF